MIPIRSLYHRIPRRIKYIILLPVIMYLVFHLTYLQTLIPTNDIQTLLNNNINNNNEKINDQELIPAIIFEELGSSLLADLKDEDLQSYINNFRSLTKEEKQSFSSSSSSSLTFWDKLKYGNGLNEGGLIGIKKDQGIS